MKKLFVLLCLSATCCFAQIKPGNKNGKKGDAGPSEARQVQKAAPMLSMTQARRGLPDTAQVIYITDPERWGNFVFDPNSTAPDDSSMVLVVGNKRYVRSADVIYPRFFGAKGDGKTDDTRALQRCLNYVKNYQTIDFQGYVYKFDRVILRQTDVILRGGGAKLLGTLIIGDEKPRTYNGKISGFYFSTEQSALLISNVRKLEISNNTFVGNDKSIYVVEGPTGQHVNAMIEINKNVFNDVNYCLFVGRSEKATWMVSSDFTFEGNVANNALITAVYANGIDGLKVINNVIFTPSDPEGRKTKKNHLRVEKESDWVIVANNNFFESGEESLFFENAKALNVTGNNFAWSGQKGLYSVIAVNGSRKDLLVNVGSNIFDSFSGNVVTLGGQASGSVGLIGNTITFNNKLPRYYGKDSLAAVKHFAVEAVDPSVLVNENNTYSVGNSTNFNTVRIGGKIVNTAGASRQFTSGDITVKRSFGPGRSNGLLEVLSSKANGDAFAGIVTVIAKSSGNMSIYQLMLSKGAKGVPAEVKLMESSGLVEGKNDNHPSFTFKIENDILMAVPVGKTSGNFEFIAKSDGALILSETNPAP